MNPREYGQHLASLAPAVTDEQASAAALILASVEQVAA